MLFELHLPLLHERAGQKYCYFKKELQEESQYRLRCFYCQTDGFQVMDIDLNAKVAKERGRGILGFKSGLGKKSFGIKGI
jgi:hypothetical protein